MEMLFADSLTDYMAMGIGFCLVVVVPLVYGFLYHQRKMAEMFHNLQASQEDRARVDRLEAELRELRERINHLVLINERASSLPPSVPDSLHVSS